ncbi:MBL fold metallo-hydrolase [Microbacterium pygmaeum]|uniref:MBL fold metallo-hydrolase n=1 Tax=Microbacterium pygmaeum TaxID=370764 RepID=UPI0012F8F572|nr:MBL fold metallo-hydrolase [Microbacterium pygmaeum]
MGDLTIHQLTEFVAPFMPALEMLPALSPAMLESSRRWMGADALDADDAFVLVYQSYVVRTPQGVVLVDTGVGNGKVRPRPEWHLRDSTGFSEEWARVGLEFGDVDDVVCTHFHPDHVGWNTVRDGEKWIPAFPNARYHFARAEVAAAEQKHADEGFEPYIDSILPIIDAGGAVLHDDSFRINDYVRVEPTHGHTRGHSMVVVGADHDLAVMTGDLFHVALQLSHPEFAFVRDADPVESTASRRAVFKRFAETDTLVCTGHLPAPSVGHLRADERGGYYLETLSEEEIHEGGN